MQVLEFFMGRTGRAIRLAMGLVLIGVGVTLGGGWWALAAFGLLPIATGVFDVCPIAPLVGRPFTGKAFRACR